MPQNLTVRVKELLDGMGLQGAGAELDAGRAVTLSVGAGNLITIMRMDDTLVLGAALAEHDEQTLLRAAPELLEIIASATPPPAFAAGSLVLETAGRPYRIGGHLDPQTVGSAQDVAEALGFLINLLDYANTTTVRSAGRTP
ncbi:hypothetical protein [Streptomyces sp. NPDC058701]|uniref:hypothetical protein n=1 Tax=Streptomyces sp. NPDC058701 TaxID=3346608 RepID=UPI0036699B3B